MAAHNPISASQRAHRVRQLWQTFEAQLAAPRAAMNQRCSDVASEANKKWRQTLQKARPSEKEHNLLITKLKKQIRGKYFADAREEWQKVLANAKLQDEDWNDMTDAETQRVIIALGGEEDDANVELNKTVAVQPPQQSLAPPPPQLSAPSISASSSTTSSYAFVNPSDFCSDDEQPEERGFSLYTMATSHDLTSEDEDAPIPVPIRGINGGWSKPQEPAKTAWRQASQGSSPELPPISNGFDFNPISHASSSSSQQARLAPPKRPPDLAGGAISASSSTSSFLHPQYPNGVTSASSTIPKNTNPTQTKARLPGPMYVGPHLSDPSDSDSFPSSDAEEEFERFKMEMRVAKILEFHEAAAQADIALAVEIYKARKLRNGDKTEDAQRVADHQKWMMRLQEEKEEERKRIVKTERERMREELRKKGNGRAARNGIAPSTSKLAWLDSYNEKNVEFGSNVDFAQILANAGIQQQQQFTEQDPLSYASETLASHQHHLQQQQLWQQQQQLLLQQQQQASSSSMPYPPQPLPQTSTQKGVPASIYAPSSQFEQQQFGRQSHPPGAFGWFDPGDDGDENREDEDEEVEEDEDEPEIPEALRQAFLKQQAQAAADLQASLNMTMPGSLNVSPPPPATTAPAPKAAATPSGWGVKNAAKAVVNGLGNNKASSTPAPAAAPTPSGWATKMAAGTPLSSGWTKKAPQLPQLPEEPANPPSQSPPKVDDPITPITPKARGPQPPATAAKGKKASPTAPANPSPAQAASSSSKPSPPPAKPAAAPAKVEKPAPAPPPPAPAPPGKKTNKKQRQQQKKGGAAPPPKAPTPPPPTTEPEPEPPVEADAQEEEEHETPIIPEAAQPAWVSSQSTIRGLPVKSRMEASSIFGEDLASTPRPGSMFGFKRQQEKGEALPKASLLRRQMQMADARQMGTPSKLTTELPKAGGASQFGFDEREYWAPNAPSVAQPMSTNAAASQQVWNPPSNSRSPPIEKTTSMPFNRLASSQRLRRSSDPVSPSPRGFELPDITNKINTTSTNTPKMSKAKKKANAKRVTIEEVSDEEGDGGPIEKLPVNSRLILEPKPSVPSGMFNNIFEYGVEDDEREDELTSSSFAPTPSTAATSPDDFAPINEGWVAAATKRLQQEKLAAAAEAKARHVRWNPQARPNLFGEDNPPDTFEAGPAMGGMSIPSSFTRRTVNASRMGGQSQQQVDVNGSGMTIWEMGQQRAKAQAAAAADDKKGGMGRDWMKAMSGAAGAAGVGNAAVGVGGDASGRYANVAIENIKRGKPAAGGNLF